MRVINHDFAANLALRFTDGYSLAPEIVVLALGNRCNLHCKMCPQWGERGTSKTLATEEIDRELSLDELRPFIEELAPHRPAVHLTGGETLLARDSLGIIELLKSHGLTVSLTTNGTLLSRKGDELVGLGVDEIVVSVDGTQPIHDAIRGVEGTFARMREGIDVVARARLSQGIATPRITTQTTITPENIVCLPELVSYLATAPVDVISIHHLEFTSADVLRNQHEVFSQAFGVDTDASWSGLPQDPEVDVEALLGAIQAVSAIDTEGREVKFVPALDAAELRSYYADPSYFPARFSERCLFPWKGLIVYPNGDIIACPNYRVGSVAADRFDEVWNGDDYRRLRSWLKERKAFPICSRCCWFYYHSV